MRGKASTVYFNYNAIFKRKKVSSDKSRKKRVMKETRGGGVPFVDHRWMIANECLNVRYLLIIT